MYANHNYQNYQKLQQSSPQRGPGKNGPIFQDSIDELNYNIADKNQNQALSSLNSLNTLSYRGG